MDIDSATDLRIRLPFSRGRATLRALIRATPAVLLLAGAAVIYSYLDFQPTGASTAVVDVSIAVAAFPLVVFGVGSAIAALRWLLATCWPAPLGIVATPDFIEFRLGPFGHKTYDAARCEVKYLFELSADGDETYEAFLPEEEQLARFLPRITHPASREPLNTRVLRFTDGDEPAAARALRPAIEAWRRSAFAPRAD